jgi:hypothetical protein
VPSFHLALDRADQGLWRTDELILRRRSRKVFALVRMLAGVRLLPHGNNGACAAGRFSAKGCDLETLWICLGVVRLNYFDLNG